MKKAIKTWIYLNCEDCPINPCEDQEAEATYDQKRGWKCMKKNKMKNLYGACGDE